MDNNQPNNNQNTSTSGFNNTNEPQAPAQNAVPAPMTANNTAPSVPQANTNKPEGEINTATPPEGTNAFAGLDSSHNFAKQTIVGGIEDSQSRSKPLFSLTKQHEGTNQQTGQVSAPSISPMPEQTNTHVTPAYNEITAGSAKSKFALIAIAVGAVLLLLAGGGYYYYFVYMNQQQSQPPEEVEQTVVENQTQPVATITIDQDPYINLLNSIEQSVESDPTQLESQLQNLNFDQIDMEISAGTTDTTPLIDPAMESTPSIPM